MMELSLTRICWTLLASRQVCWPTCSCIGGNSSATFPCFSSLKFPFHPDVPLLTFTFTLSVWSLREMALWIHKPLFNETLPNHLSSQLVIYLVSSLTQMSLDRVLFLPFASPLQNRTVDIGPCWAVSRWPNWLEPPCLQHNTPRLKGEAGNIPRQKCPPPACSIFCHFFRNIMDTSCKTEPLPKLEAGACVEAENVARQRRERARSAREKIENVTPLWLRSEKKQIDGEIMSLYGGNSAHDRRRFLPW